MSIIERRPMLAIGLYCAMTMIILSGGTQFATAQALIGAAAPAFTLTDSNGRNLSPADFNGKSVVLEWTSHECPYVGKHYRGNNMQALQKKWTGQGVVWLSVISSAPGQPGYVSPQQANKLTATGNSLCPRSGRPAVLPRDLLQHQRLHYLRPELSVRRSEELFRRDPKRSVPPHVGQHLHIHHRRPDHRPAARQVRRHAVDAGVPRPRSRPGARGAAVGGAGVARNARLAMDVRFALQRDQLDADRDRA